MRGRMRCSMPARSRSMSRTRMRGRSMSPRCTTSSARPRRDCGRSSRITALFARAAEVDGSARRALAAAGRALPPHETYPVAEQDWVRATQAQFGPIRIADANVDRSVVVRCRRCDGDQSRARSRARVRHGIASDDAAVLAVACARAAGRRVRSRLRLRLREFLRSPHAVSVPAASSEPISIRRRFAASDANAQRNRVAATFLSPDRLAAVERAPFDVIVANILANPLQNARARDCAPRRARRAHRALGDSRSASRSADRGVSAVV